MNALLLLLLPVALAASPDQRIVNGQNVNIANYPWQVRAQTLQSFLRFMRREFIEQHGAYLYLGNLFITHTI